MKHFTALVPRKNLPALPVLNTALQSFPLNWEEWQGLERRCSDYVFPHCWNGGLGQFPCLGWVTTFKRQTATFQPQLTRWIPGTQNPCQFIYPPGTVSPCAMVPPLLGCSKWEWKAWFITCWERKYTEAVIIFCHSELVEEKNPFYICSPILLVVRWINLKFDKGNMQIQFLTEGRELEVLSLFLPSQTLPDLLRICSIFHCHCWLV